MNHFSAETSKVMRLTLATDLQKCVLRNSQSPPLLFKYMQNRTGFVCAKDFYSHEEEQTVLQHLNNITYGADAGDSKEDKMVRGVTVAADNYPPVHEVSAENYNNHQSFFGQVAEEHSEHSPWVEAFCKKKIIHRMIVNRDRQTDGDKPSSDRFGWHADPGKDGDYATVTTASVHYVGHNNKDCDANWAAYAKDSMFSGGLNIYKKGIANGLTSLKK